MATKHAETLMSHFVMKDETLTVCVSDVPFKLHAYYDWRDLPNKEERIRKYNSSLRYSFVLSLTFMIRYMQEEAVRGFDIHSPTDPLMRVHLIRISPSTCLLFIVAHHLVIDGWSLGVLTEDLTKAYYGNSKHPTSPPVSLPLLPNDRTYSYFARWQRACMGNHHSVREKCSKYPRT